MEITTTTPPDYARMATAIQYLADHYQEQPNLATIAAQVHLSPFHFERLFRQWTGVTPSQFVRYLTLDHAKALLAPKQHATPSLFEAAHEVGLSGPSRLHDLFVTMEAVTPGAWKKAGAGLTIWYGFHLTVFGHVLMAVTERGICHLSFVAPGASAEAEAALRAAWPDAELIHEAHRTANLAAQLQEPPSAERPLRLLVQGTNFQVQVWQALLRIPHGHVATYQDVANEAGRPDAVRAVANAIGRNAIAVLIPCHRVLRKHGAAGGYRWGVPRKRALLAWEAAMEAR